MRYIKDGHYSHAVCDFCEVDASGNRGKVWPVGEKGICESCLHDLALLLRTIARMDKERE